LTYIPLLLLLLLLRLLLLQAAGSHPVFLTRMDYHMALVNSAALQQAGLADSAGSGCGCSCDPGNDAGGVDRDAATGQPTGLLRWVPLQVWVL
jgi:predicted amidohydrolase YtcJ